MDLKNNKRIVFGLVLSFWLVYTFSMCMRSAYTASMAKIKDEYDVSNVVASLPITLFSIFYAITQFVLAFVIAKINIKRYMTITFSISGLLFISVFFYSPVGYIGSVLAINGITLGAVWCGSVLIFAKYLSRKTMNNAILFMGAGFAVGSAISFAVSSLAMSLGNWRISFIVFGSAFLLSMFYMLYSVGRVEKANIKPSAEDNIPLKKQVYTADKISAKPLYIMALIAVFFSSFLYSGVSTWMPTILKNSFGVTNARATLITTLFPMVVYLGPVLSVILCNKLKNDFLVVVLVSVITLCICIALCYAYDLNIIITVSVILALGILLRLLSYIFVYLLPIHIKEYSNSGSTAAMLNSSASVSGAVSPFLIALILDLSGNDWQVDFLVLSGVALIMLIVCLVFYIVDIKRHKIYTSFENDRNLI